MIRDRARATTPPPIIPADARTPRGTIEVIERSQQLGAAIRANEILTPSTKRTYLQYIKGSEACAHSRELSEQELLGTKVYQLAKNIPNSQLKRVVQKHGSVSFDMVRAQKRQREETELEKAEERVRRNEVALERERIALEKERYKPWTLVFSELKKAVKAYNKRVALEKRSRTVYKRCMVAR